MISKEEQSRKRRKIFGERKRTRTKKEENIWLVKENKTRDRKKKRISWKGKCDAEKTDKQSDRRSPRMLKQKCVVYLCIVQIAFAPPPLCGGLRYAQVARN